jgi:hypothetical protein
MPSQTPWDLYDSEGPSASGGPVVVVFLIIVATIAITTLLGA